MGARGEGWVIGQFVIAVGILIATFFTRVELPQLVRLLGSAMLVSGAVVIAFATFRLGKNLTPYPKPKEGEHTLITGGIYGVVRHPIYFGFALAALGWTLYWETLLGIALSLVLFVWFDFKARHEEKWLTEKYPDYAQYKTRVKKLIPFIY